MTPEQLARLQIDKMLAQSGWTVQDFAQMNIFAQLGVAIREFPLKKGQADYMLYVDGKAVGVVEAKPEGHTLIGVETQSAKYRDGLPANLPHYRLPLPFAYELTGEQTRFTNIIEPDARSREVFTFHRPEELLRLVKLDKQTRGLLREMPLLNATRLWSVQVDSIQRLEESLAHNRPRSLIEMATGSGKTYTAASFCYRLIKFARARRILFLVDRKNLGAQALNEFQQYASPYTNSKFTEEYVVQHLRRNTVDQACKVCITTIQRLYSILQGEEDFDEANEEGSLFELESPIAKEPPPLAYNPNFPIETFDFIVIDECHRSIYNYWRQVLEYFDAFLIGLTATKTPQAVAFFNGNVVQDYNHEKAVVDGVNVGYDIYRIETKVTKDGAKLTKSEMYVPHRDRRTKKVRNLQLADDVPYAGTQLDRDVVNKSQIRLVIRTFRDKLPEIFLGRTEVPKTLVFAKTDLHAEDIVEVIREEFGKGNEFCQKITSKTTGAKPEDLLASFRNDYNPRIAVTVDMIATGTDVKPLECLLFMRDIKSVSYFEQMKGRGCRIIDPDTLKTVTPDAHAKTHFVIVDAVGVCESPKQCSKPLDRKPSVKLDKLMGMVAAGMVHEDIVSTLAARLARLNRECDTDQDEAIRMASGGKTLSPLTAALLDSIDPDKNRDAAIVQFKLPPGQEPTEEQMDAAEQVQMKEALRPFTNPNLRNVILEIRGARDQVFDEENIDSLLRAGFDATALEKAKALTQNFHRFIEDNKDQIEALQVLYSRPYRAGLRYRHIKDLATKLRQFHVDPKEPKTLGPLWQAYQLLEPDKVQGTAGKLVDIIALVRHAIDPATPLAPIGMTTEERYQGWLAEQIAAGVVFTADQRRWLDAVKDHIASNLSIDLDDFETVPFNQFGGLGRAHELFGDKLNAILDDLNARLAA